MNVLQPSAREAFLRGLIAWDVDAFVVVAVDATYVYSAAHDFLDDVLAGARVATSAALTAKTYAAGVADAADVTFSALPAGDTITGLWIVKDTGVEATSRLVAWFDTKADTTAINVPTNGGDVVVTWPNTGNRIFKV